MYLLTLLIKSVKIFIDTTKEVFFKEKSTKKSFKKFDFFVDKNIPKC